MRYLKWLRPSPALVFAVIAVVLAWSGGANSASPGRAASAPQFTVLHRHSPYPVANALSVMCPGGWVATGGGSGSAEPAKESRPVGTEGWYAHTSRGPLTVYVICERP
jgi:hypothetical protein